MKRGHVPVRTCRGCGRKAPKHELNRYVLDQGHLVEDDQQGQGYGLYCCPDVTCMTKIYKNKKLRKKLSEPIRNEDGSN